MNTMRGFGAGGGAFRTLGLVAVLALALSVSFGCSKKEDAAKDQTSAQAPGTDPAKEHFDKGVQYSLRGEYDAAIKEYEETIKSNPNSPEAYNNMGFAYMDKGDTDKAVELQKKALELNPKFANAYYGMAQAMEKKGDKAGALKNWKEFKKLSEPHSRWWTKAEERIQALEKKAQK